MHSAWVWLILAIPAGWAIWQLQVPEPVITAPYLGLILLMLGLLAGLRLATDAMHRLLQDLIRVNRSLAKQNDELVARHREPHQELEPDTPDSRDPAGDEDRT